MPEYNCGTCDEEFESEKDKLEHELEEHDEELSSHDRSQKKNNLNKLREKEKSQKQQRNRKLKMIGGGIAAAVVIGFFGLQMFQLAQSTVPAVNQSLGIGTGVHWHADYRITVCGQERTVRGGPILAHTHGEKTFHLEGVRQRKEQATLGWVMGELSTGEFNSTHVFGKSTCDGEPANLTVSVNSQKIEDPTDYILRDGDFVLINLEKN